MLQRAICCFLWIVLHEILKSDVLVKLTDSLVVKASVHRALQRALLCQFVSQNADTFGL